MLSGTVKWFSPSKGYGFITTESNDEIFLHFSGLVEGQDRRLYPGDRVDFEIADGEKGKKAVNVTCTEQVARPEK